MRLDESWLRRAVLLSAVSATVALAAPQPYDFTGHWTGTASSRGVTVPLSIDFAPTSDPRMFTGTTTLDSNPPITCTFTAKYTRKLKLSLHCDNGSNSTVMAKLNTAQDLTGSFTVGGRHGGRHRAKFTLTKTSA